MGHVRPLHHFLRLLGLACVLLAPAAVRAQYPKFTTQTTQLWPGLLPSGTVPGGIFYDVIGQPWIADTATNLVEYRDRDFFNLTDSGITGLNQPHGIVYLNGTQAVAVVMVADTGNNRIVFQFQGQDGVKHQVVLPDPSTQGSTALSGPTGLGFDSSRNLLYIADTGNNRILKLQITDYTAPAYTLLATIAVTGPTGVAADAAGNLFVSANPVSYKFVPSPSDANSYTAASPSLASGLMNASSVAVTETGDVFITDAGTGKLWRDRPNAGGTYDSSDMGATGTASLVTVDSGDDPIYWDASGHTFWEIRTRGVDFGPVQIGATSKSAILTFSPPNTGRTVAPTRPVALTGSFTGGLAGLDFQDDGLPWPAIVHPAFWGPGSIGNFSVSFRPLQTGLRQGVVQATAIGLPVSPPYDWGTFTLTGTGVGTGAHLTFLPPSLSTVVANLNTPTGVAVNPGGDVFFLDAVVPQVQVQYAGQSSPVNLPLDPAIGPLAPYGLALDGKGDLYFTDQAESLPSGTPLQGHNRLVKVHLSDGLDSNNGYTYDIVDNTLGSPAGVAVDASGNIFAVDNFNPAASGNAALLEYPGGLSQNRKTVLAGNVSGNFLTGNAVAVDKSGNVYVDFIHLQGSKAPFALAQFVPPAPGSTGWTMNTVLDNMPGLAGLAVDATNGFLYLVDSGETPYKLFVINLYGAASFGTPFELTGALAATGSLSNSQTLAVDPNGNLYFPETNLITINGVTNAVGVLEKIDFADPPKVTFQVAAQGDQATAQAITFFNTSGTDLYLVPPATAGATNPAFSSTAAGDGFAVDAASPFQPLASSDAQVTLHPGDSRTLLLDFQAVNAGQTLDSLGLQVSLVQNPQPTDLFTETIDLEGDVSQQTVLQANPGKSLVIQNPFSGGLRPLAYAPAYAGGGSPTITQDTSGNLTVTGLETGTTHLTLGGTNDQNALVTQQQITIQVTQTPVTITLSDLAKTYTGQPQAPTVTTDVAGVKVDLQYINQADPSPSPTKLSQVIDAGTYTVVATLDDPVTYSYAVPAPTGPLTIAKAPAGITLSNLTRTYTGQALAPTVTVSTGLTPPPASVQVGLSYTQGSAPGGAPVANPTQVGSYYVTATITDPNFTGPAVNGVLRITRAASSVTLDSGSLAQTYTGAPLRVTVTTTPPHLSVFITYDGRPAPPVHPGRYRVLAVVLDPDAFPSSVSGWLVIARAQASITLDSASLSQTFTGRPLRATASTVPPGLRVNLDYTRNGHPAIPRAVGSYGVKATVEDRDYQGSTTGTLVISGP